jgi:hypothetical protein
MNTVCRYFAELCEVDGADTYRLYSTHIACGNRLIPVFCVKSADIDSEGRVLSVTYTPADPEVDEARLTLAVSDAAADAAGLFISEVNADIARRRFVFDRLENKIRSDFTDMPDYDRTAPKKRRYDYAQGIYVGDELTDCYGECDGDNRYYLGDYKNGKMHGEGYLRLTVEDDPILAAPDDTEIYDGIFKDGNFSFGRATVYSMARTETYGEFSGYTPSGYASQRSHSSFGYAHYYEGGFKNGSFSGFGRYADLKSAYMYVGEFESGRPQGRGDMIMPNGITVHCDTVERAFVVGKVTVSVPGEGTYTAEVGPRTMERTVTYENGDVFTGSVSVYGLPKEGTLTEKDGTAYACRYDHGILIEKIKK